LTAEQLDAHLGVGVPKGWSPVDAGDARVFVPVSNRGAVIDQAEKWSFESRTSCVGGNGIGVVISIGILPNAACGERATFLPEQGVALFTSSQSHKTGPSFTVHGYRFYRINSYTPNWTFYDIPQLGTRIATHGTLGNRILDTIAPSSRKVALVTATEPIPNHWHALTKDGVSLSIPPSWLVTRLDDSCGLFDPNSEPLLVPPNLASCPGMCVCGPTGPHASPQLQSGAILYETQHNIYAPTQTGHSIATLHHGPTTITIYDEVNSPPTLDLFVHKTGSNVTHILTLGLDQDGRIGGDILASIRAVT